MLEYFLREHAVEIRKQAAPGFSIKAIDVASMPVGSFRLWRDSGACYVCAFQMDLVNRDEDRGEIPRRRRCPNQPTDPTPLFFSCGSEKGKRE